MKKKSLVLLIVIAMMLTLVGTASAQTEDTPPSIVEIVVGSDDFDTLEAAVVAADLVGTLSGDGPFTVFAPTDDAFAKLPPSVIGELTTNRIDVLTNVLLYHVAPGSFEAADVVATDSLPSALGPAISVDVNSAGVFVEGAQVQIVNIQASNGVIHVIDSVILPPFAPAEAPAPTVNFATDFTAPEGPIYTNFGFGSTPLGEYPQFSVNEDLVVTWNPVSFAEGANGAYRVAIRQYDPIFGGFTEQKVAFHWDENPNGEQFTFGAFGFGETFFLGLPSFVVVEPYTFSTFVDTATGVTEYVYTPVEGVGAQWSEAVSFTQ